MLRAGKAAHIIPSVQPTIPYTPCQYTPQTPLKNKHTSYQYTPQTPLNTGLAAKLSCQLK